MATTINGSTGASQIQDDTVTTAKVNDSQITNALMADDAIGIAELSATGTASSSTFLRGDNAWAAPGGGGLTLLTTLSPTSGTSIVASGLDLSTYKFLYVNAFSVGNTVGGGKLRWKETGGTFVDLIDTFSGASVYAIYGQVTQDLSTGLTAVNRGYLLADDLTLSAAAGSGAIGVNTAIDTATTSITFDVNSETFDKGTIKIYGLK
jgi:hypothetical protein